MLINIISITKSRKLCISRNMIHLHNNHTGAKVVSPFAILEGIKSTGTVADLSSILLDSDTDDGSSADVVFLSIVFYSSITVTDVCFNFVLVELKDVDTSGTDAVLFCGAGIIVAASTTGTDVFLFCSAAKLEGAATSSTDTGLFCIIKLEGAANTGSSDVDILSAVPAIAGANLDVSLLSDLLGDALLDNLLSDASSDNLLTDVSSDNLQADASSDILLTDTSSNNLLTDTSSNILLTDASYDNLLIDDSLPLAS